MKNIIQYLKDIFKSKAQKEEERAKEMKQAKKIAEQYQAKYEKWQHLLDFFSANLVLIAKMDGDCTDDVKRLICQIMKYGHNKSLLKGWTVTELPEPKNSSEVSDFFPDNMEDRLNMVRDMILLSKLTNNTTSTYTFIESIATRMGIDNNQFAEIFNNVDVNMDIGYCHHLKIDVIELYDIVESILLSDFATDRFSLYNIGTHNFSKTLNECVNIINSHKELSPRGKTEALILCYQMIHGFSNLGSGIYCNKNATKEFTDFINQRLNFYKEELEKIDSSPTYTPMFIYNALFLNPLNENVGYGSLKEFKEPITVLLDLMLILKKVESHLTSLPSAFSI